MELFWKFGPAECDIYFAISSSSVHSMLHVHVLRSLIYSCNQLCVYWMVIVISAESIWTSSVFSVKKCASVRMLPMECQFLNKTALVAATGPLPQPVKHFALKRKPKSAILRAELLQKCKQTLSKKCCYLGHQNATKMPCYTYMYLLNVPFDSRNFKNHSWITRYSTVFEIWYTGGNYMRFFFHYHMILKKRKIRLSHLENFWVMSRNYFQISIRI